MSYTKYGRDLSAWVEFQKKQGYTDVYYFDNMWDFKAKFDDIDFNIENDFVGFKSNDVRENPYAIAYKKK